MKKSSFLALAIAPMILGAPLVNADPVFTDPVGFVKLTLEPGLQAVGAAMLHPAVVAGAVASSDATSITLDGTHTVETALTSGTAYYVEVASGDTWEGERFDVDVAGSSGSVLAIAASSNNTVSLGATDLSGHSIRVRAHRTLGDIFDPGQLNPGGSVGTSDNVLLFEGGAFVTYWLRAGAFGAPDEWRRASPDQPANGLVLAPGVGLMFRGSGATVELVTNIGEVRSNSFRQNFSAGLNLIGEGHPLDNTPTTRVMTVSNGFQAGGSVGTSDNILVWNGTGYDTYWFRAGAFGAPDEWRQASPDQPASDIQLAKADGAFFLRKQAPDSLYEAPKNF